MVIVVLLITAIVVVIAEHADEPKSPEEVMPWEFKVVNGPPPSDKYNRYYR